MCVCFLASQITGRGIHTSSDHGLSWAGHRISFRAVGEQDSFEKTGAMCNPPTGTLGATVRTQQ